MDGRLFMRYRGARHIDSGFAATESDVSLGSGFATTVADFAHDPRLRHLKRNDLFQMHSEAKILEMIDMGRNFGHEQLLPNLGTGNLSYSAAPKQPMLHFLLDMVRNKSYEEKTFWEKPPNEKPPPP